MAYTQAQIDALKAAIASGALTVKNGDNLITYRNISEMRTALAMMLAEVNAASRPRRAVAQFGRGF